MLLIRVSLAPHRGPAAVVDAELLVDAVWAAAERGDSIEHVTARATPDGFEVGVFLLAATGLDGRATAYALIARVLATSPMLRHWTIVAEQHVALDALDPGRMRPAVAERPDEPR